jgi:hypothetical protein
MAGFFFSFVAGHGTISGSNMSIESENKYRPEEAEGKRRPEAEETPESNLEQLPTDTEMWAVMESKDKEARELMSADKEKFHEEAAKVAFGSPAEFAMGVAGMATMELKPFLAAFEEMTKQPPVPPEVQQARGAVREALENKGGES